jgi:transaldolase
MKIFIDSADLGEIRKVAQLGIVDGVTTNPSLIAKSGGKFIDVLAQISELVDGPISAEVVATETSAMLKEANLLKKVHKNIVIKLPLTPDGLQACKALSKEGIQTNVTLCFQSGQALLAAKCGATYISPFIGRLDDVGASGMRLIEEIRQIYSNYGYTTQILAASIRSPQHIVDSALAGADVATCPLKPLMQLYDHPLTEKGLQIFLEDWKKTGQNIV